MNWILLSIAVIEFFGCALLTYVAWHYYCMAKDYRALTLMWEERNQKTIDSLKEVCDNAVKKSFTFDQTPNHKDWN